MEKHSCPTHIECGEERGKFVNPGLLNALMGILCGMLLLFLIGGASRLDKLFARTGPTEMTQFQYGMDSRTGLCFSFNSSGAGHSYVPCSPQVMELVEKYPLRAIAKLYYGQDPRTGLCYALAAPESHANVPCTPKVLKLMGEQ